MPIKDDTLEDVSVRHRKKRKSNTSKSRRKSKHKHDYEKCLVTVDRKQFFLAERCIVCDKYGEVVYFLPSKNQKANVIGGRQTYVMMDQEELLSEYGDLPKYCVGSLYKNIKTLETIH